MRWCGAMAMVVVLACGDDTLVEQDASTTDGSDGGSVSSGSVGPDTASSTSTGTESTTGAPGCVATIEFGAFTQLTTVDLSEPQIYDFNGDGTEEIIGRRGEILYLRPDGVELIESPEPIQPSSCIAGEFDGEAGADVLCNISEYRLRLHVGGADEPVVDTLVNDVTSMDARDMDADGIDDLVLGIENGRRVQVWRGRASGEFEQTMSTSWSGLGGAGVFAMLEPPRIDLAVVGDSALHVHVGDGSGAFIASDSVPVYFSDGYVVPVRAGDRDVIQVSWAYSQLESHSGAAFIGRDADGTLLGRSYVLSPNWYSGVPVAGDFDDDGEPELIIGNGDPAGPRIDAACGPGEDMVLCGSTAFEHDRMWSGLLHDPWRLVDTGSDGTWVAPITMTPC
ncbi:MAG: hypothetical protein IAG13_09895 [Deltaproteobacteria bacterium]|nr:hypothetical protein [Nannocystaceae bacterium]